MVAERRARLARATDLVEQQTLHREVEAYEARRHAAAMRWKKSKTG